MFKYQRATAAALAVSAIGLFMTVGAGAGASVAPRAAVHGHSSGLAASPRAAKKVTIGFISDNIASSGILLYKTAFMAQAKKYGWTVKAVDTNGNVVNAVTQAEQWVSQGVTAIVDDTVDNASMTAAITAASAAKIPWFSVSSGWVTGVTNEVETNEVANGANLAQSLAEAMGGKGNILQLDWAALPAVAQQDSGVAAVFSALYPNIHILQTIQLKVPGWAQDAYTQVTNYLQSNTNVQAIIIPWDDFAANVVSAVDQAGLGKKIIIAGFDMDPGTTALLRGNTPFKMTEALNIPAFAVKTALNIKAYLAHQGVPPVSSVPTCLATHANAPKTGGLSNKAFWKSCYSQPAVLFEG
jgi:ABC-type sugar transport system substrate-binding protein